MGRSVLGLRGCATRPSRLSATGVRDIETPPSRSVPDIGTGTVHEVYASDRLFPKDGSHRSGRCCIETESTPYAAAPAFPSGISSRSIPSMPTRGPLDAEQAATATVERA
ncbi:hypothetical protein AO398_26320 [Methylobacterium sp. GXS13]|uniref:hypothetical protein n=1 Tax=Methylobacterium sp. GXS13 TaxID=1730094 RepID=UPI00071B87DC|nr:hypothetical protein [Methylobacterium sp. GXS13]KST56978.1 hypothetical protein AO398_26320 [Methylobacterium sp. GXS13]